MGRNRGRRKQDSNIKKTNSSTPHKIARQQHPITLREESAGKKSSASADASSVLKVQHLQRLATWASGEGGVAPLGAFLGERLAANAESSGIPLEPSTLLCQRCETILQPGFNCTIRIKKNPKKAGQKKKSVTSCQNCVVYTCHFCQHQNLKWGTAKGYVKSLLSSRRKCTAETSSKVSRAKIEKKKRTAVKVELEQSTGAVFAQAEASSALEHVTVEKDKADEVAGATLKTGSFIFGSSHVEMKKSADKVVITTSTPEKYVPVKELVASTNAESMSEMKYESPEKAKLSEGAAAAQSKTDSSTGSELCNTEMDSVQEVGDKNLRTPFRKLVNVSDKKRKNSNSLSGEVPIAGNKSATKDPEKETGSSKRRRRKGWSTLKQIAEKDEHERSRRIENFVIPFLV